MTRRTLMHVVAANILVAVLLAPQPAEAHDGRWLDAGPHNGLLSCESSPNARAAAIVTPRGVPLAPAGTRRARAEVRVDQQAAALDRGAWQFIPSTWDWVATERGALHLVGKDPRFTTLATQFRQAEWLRINGGIAHWTCSGRFGDGTGPRYVTAELVTPRRPRRCARNLHRQWGARPAVAASICNHQPTGETP